MAIKYTYQPDYAVAPGATLRELLEERGIPQADLALRTGLAEKTISQLVNGIAPLTYETAAKLELALGVPARFWNTRELHYQEAIARSQEEAKLAEESAWLKEVPLSALIERGFVETSESVGSTVRQVLAFFGVSSIEAWRDTWLTPCAQYRGGAVQKSKPGYVAAWIRMGELAADKLVCEPFDAKLFTQALHEIRHLTTELAEKWYPKSISLCAQAGVALVFVPEIPTASLSGVTKWLSKDKALLQLSLKYKADDQLWFTLFHEAGHILRHGKRQVFVESTLSGTDEEEEANLFARDILIPPSRTNEFAFLKSKAAIRGFAQSLRIAPGIVVGRLQREGILPPSHCNDLKRKLKWGLANE
jgi:HTH-type transcriptional regulator/antitoxin HigA